MKQLKPSDQTEVTGTQAGADKQQHVQVPASYRWRFRIAAALFTAWLAYLFWVATKVITQ